MLYTYKYTKCNYNIKYNIKAGITALWHSWKVPGPLRVPELEDAQTPCMFFFVFVLFKSTSISTWLFSHIFFSVCACVRLHVQMDVRAFVRTPV